MEFLSREQIIEAVSKVKNGTYVRIGYQSELPVKADLKKQGYHAFKLTETTVRLGVNYGRIASVIARKAEESLEQTVKRANNYEWIIKDKIRHNTSTGKDYLYITNVNGTGHNTKSVYILLCEDEVKASCKKDEFQKNFSDVLIPSYWNKSGFGYGEVRNISFENIYKVGTAGDSIQM